MTLKEVMRRPKPGERYRHCKGGVYEVVCVGIHTETQEPLVVYRALHHHAEGASETTWVRPLTMSSLQNPISAATSAFWLRLAAPTRRIRQYVSSSAASPRRRNPAFRQESGF